MEPTKSAAGVANKPKIKARRRANARPHIAGLHDAESRMCLVGCGPVVAGGMALLHGDFDIIFVRRV